jgi:hypothetical protein
MRVDSSKLAACLIGGTLGIGVALGLTAPCAVAAQGDHTGTGVREAETGDRTGTAIARLGAHGRILEIATGTRGGRCYARGDALVCEDGGRSVSATLRDGCLEAVGGAHCEILDPNATPDEGEPRIVVDAEGSSVEIECETGAKRGNVYSVSDGDGSGACGADHDVDGKTNGGTCSRGGHECLSFDCTHGCLSGSSGCECHLKSKARTTVLPAQ